jgi:hypothetical protein
MAFIKLLCVLVIPKNQKNSCYRNGKLNSAAGLSDRYVIDDSK